MRPVRVEPVGDLLRSETANHSRVIPQPPSRPSILDKQMLTTKIGGQHVFNESNYFLRPKPKKPPPWPESDESSFDSSSSQISWQLGHIGKRSGSREGIQTFPHSATTGVP